ncbi:hypothetical protein A2U01_0021205, partial [Trifolium medium]|nr:hypothetical protein [Trifolium medium]
VTIVSTAQHYGLEARVVDDPIRNLIADGPADRGGDSDIILELSIELNSTKPAFKVMIASTL